ncbi:hypothetical protein K6L44_15350 [Gluconacetobacter entanii]|jgi:hypothetical protein|uniref:Lipoprotein n=1 Tax=Gluconacetobacter entanii TaxID=108528 RepID=A0ABT3K5Q0_9PROT|nr:hypothetical protein [Gluconacetobacter entanii]MBE7619374.1 hypothetical protein [Komagataeibacter sp. FXV2]MCE2578741.1 hypothetical protein [Komagataeibacter sp. FNDCR1]MBY4641335.1 hypothetical protein [Gluconacetobacter entanii]MCW4581545.1 hypothetical protein [Gluconacetobacter entanii]MCW4585033.1 hypothetical protein [Gluconacetobacter entanii]
MMWTGMARMLCVAGLLAGLGACASRQPPSDPSQSGGVGGMTGSPGQDDSSDGPGGSGGPGMG